MGRSNSSVSSSSDDERHEKKDDVHEKIEEAVTVLATEGDDVPARAEWGNHCEFFLSSLGLAVGLGNIWRFPYVCYNNGGGTFLIPYFLMLFFVGLPMFYLEMVMGQYAGLSATKIFARISPGLRGMGYGMITIPTIINFQYVVIMAYAVFYLFAGMQKELPWGTCNHDYNSDHCYSAIDAADKNLEFNGPCEDFKSNYTFFAKQCINGSYFCELNNKPDEGYTLTYNPSINSTACILNETVSGYEPVILGYREVTYRDSASEDYWYKRVLHFEVNNSTLNTTVNSWEDWGQIRWELVGCLALSWMLICAALIQGIASYGKVAYFTTLFPYVVLTIMLGYVATLPGFSYGLEYYLIPHEIEQLLKIDAWNAAASQIFYSLGVGVGSQLLLSSYNQFNANAHLDALLIGFGNSATSIYAGFTVFGVMGYLAKQKGVDISEVVSAEAGLAFIVYPEAVSLMDVPQLFSFLFFFMLNLLAISSVCGSWEALIAAFMDEFPKMRTKRVPIMLISCTGAFLCGLSMCFDSGFLMFTIMNNRCGNAILLLAFIELVTLAWFYGSWRILIHIKEMGMQLPKFMEMYWWTCWTIITPAIIFVVTIMQWVNFPGDSFENYTFPPAVQAMGWMLELTGVGIVAFVTIGVIIKRCLDKKPVAFIQSGPMMTPNKLWGPRADSGLPKGYDNRGFVI